MGSRVTQDGGVQEALRRGAEDGAGGAGGRGSAGAAAERAGPRAEAGARAPDGGRALAELARGGRTRVPVRGRAGCPCRPHLRVGLQLLRGAGRAHLRAAQRWAQAPRRLAAAPQDPARALPPGAGPEGAGRGSVPPSHPPASATAPRGPLREVGRLGGPMPGRRTLERAAGPGGEGVRALLTFNEWPKRAPVGPDRRHSHVTPGVGVVTTVTL